MHCGRDACLLQPFLYGITVLHSNGVLGVDAGVVGFDVGELDGGHGLRGHGLLRFARNDGL